MGLSKLRIPLKIVRTMEFNWPRSPNQIPDAQLGNITFLFFKTPFTFQTFDQFKTSDHFESDQTDPDYNVEVLLLLPSLEQHETRPTGTVVLNITN